MNTLDAIYLLIIFFFAFFGAVRGLIRGAFGLGGAILGVVAAKLYYAELAGRLAFWFGGTLQVLNAVSVCAIFLGTLIAMTICGRILTRLVNLVFLGWLNRLLGFFFGAAKGAVLTMILSFMLSMALPPTTTLFKESVIHQGLLALIGMLPGDSVNQLTGKRDDLEKYLKEKGRELKGYSEKNLADRKILPGGGTVRH